MTIRRKLSHDGLEVAKDRTEVNVMKRLEARNEMLESRCDKAEAERNSAMRELGELGASFKFASEALADIRAEQKSVARDAKGIADALVVNTDLTRSAVEKADAAYQVGNNLSAKIAQIGLRIAEGNEK